MSYLAGHVKRNPDTGEVALRTTFAEEGQFAFLAWLIATPTIGARNARSTEVEGWDDLHTPEPVVVAGS